MRSKKNVLLLGVLLLPSLLLTSFGIKPASAGFQNRKGTIKGRVIDEEIRSAVPHATVSISGTKMTAATDYEGWFTIHDVPVDSYVLEVSAQFYGTKLHPDVVVKSSRITQVEIALKLSVDVQEREEITVTAGFYSDNKQKSLSVTSFSNEEIRRAAGSGGDVSRIVSGLPSIARVNDQVNSLIVRGGSPIENSFYIDNIAIPNINHYPIQGSSGGALALLNVDFIKDVQFFSGGFSPIYGNRLSSVMDVSFREGNRDEVDFQADFSMAGVGLITEGPLPGAKGSWMLSARHSYLDLIDKYFDVGAAPAYGDIQGKLTYDLSAGGQLTLLGVWGNDKSGWDKEKSLDLGDSNYGYHDAVNQTFGVNWFQTWGARGFSTTSLSRSHILYDIIFSDTSSDRLILQNNSWEEDFTLRNVNTFRLSPAFKINFGLEAQYLRIRNDYALGAGSDVLGNPYPEINIDVQRDATRFAGYLNAGIHVLQNMTVNLGVRVDHLSYTRNTNVSPRFSLSYSLNDRTSLNAAAGIFYQSIPNMLLFQNEAHQDLKDPRAVHYVLGISHLLTSSTRFTLEGYYKDYRNMPLDPDQPSLYVLDEISYNGFYIFHDQLMDSGKAQAYGVEIMLQKKLADKVYGLVSASYFRTRYLGFDGTWRSRVYDNKIIFSVEGGYKPSRTWEFSCKWHYAGGVPYTPYDLETSSALNSGIFDSSRINGERQVAYHSLNLRADKRFYFGRSNLTAYFSIWNVYNRKNIAFNFWNTLENRPDFENQWGLLPILGLEFEF